MNVIDLFSGCGGMSLGFQNAGFEILSAFDRWAPAVRVYRDNFQHPIYETDLSDETAWKTIRGQAPQIIVGGPPCQDFSSAGKRDETLGRADLTRSFAQIVSYCRPEWFVMENVARIQKSRALREAMQIFNNAGYGMTAQVLDASYCGVPQTRKRFFLVGRLRTDDGFLQPFFEGRQAPQAMTVRDYLGDAIGVQYYYRHPRSYVRRGIFSVDEPSPTIRGVNRPVPAGYIPHPGDPVAVTPDLRPLTTRERSRIQTFPPGFIFNEPKTVTEQMIGNAVPVKLAEFVAGCIRAYINDPEQYKR